MIWKQADVLIIRKGEDKDSVKPKSYKAQEKFVMLLTTNRTLTDNNLTMLETKENF